MTNFVSLKEYVLNEVVWNYTLAPIPQSIADWGSSCLSTTSALASPVKLIPSSLLMLLNWRTADFCSEFPFHAWYSIMTHCLKRSMKVSLNFWSRLTSFQWHKWPQTEMYRTPDTILLARLLEFVHEGTFLFQVSQPSFFDWSLFVLERYGQIKLTLPWTEMLLKGRLEKFPRNWEGRALSHWRFRLNSPIQLPIINLAIEFSLLGGAPFLQNCSSINTRASTQNSQNNHSLSKTVWCWYALKVFHFRSFRLKVFAN